ncbi:MAG: hypothetical protein INR64_19285, partial [Caulobacteraceae bacterium]|nr:hypothetical protein [Caulobacter sp.]
MHLEPPSQVEAASISASAARQARAEALVRRTEPADVAALLGDLDLLFSAIEPHLLTDAAPLAGIVSAAADVLESARAFGWHTLTAAAAAAAPPPKEVARPGPAPKAPSSAGAGPAK